MTAFPPKLAKSIVEALSMVEQLGKSEKNTFDKYNFVSIDKFLALANRICRNAGFFVLMDESECEFFSGKNEKPWLMLKFAFTLVHDSGEASEPMYRSVAVPANGAQAFGSGQSYALKQFFRALLLVPTGDKDDPDFSATADMPQKRASSYKNKKEVDWAAFEKACRAATTGESLDRIAARVAEHDEDGSWSAAYVSSAHEEIAACREALDKAKTAKAKPATEVIDDEPVRILLSEKTPAAIMAAYKILSTGDMPDRLPHGALDIVEACEGNEDYCGLVETAALEQA